MGASPSSPTSRRDAGDDAVITKGSGSTNQVPTGHSDNGRPCSRSSSIKREAWITEAGESSTVIDISAINDATSRSEDVTPMYTKRQPEGDDQSHADQKPPHLSQDFAVPNDSKLHMFSCAFEHRIPHNVDEEKSRPSSVGYSKVDTKKLFFDSPRNRLAATIINAYARGLLVRMNVRSDVLDPALLEEGERLVISKATGQYYGNTTIIRSVEREELDACRKRSAGISNGTVKLLSRRGICIPITTNTTDETFICCQSSSDYASRASARASIQELLEEINSSTDDFQNRSRSNSATNREGAGNFLARMSISYDPNYTSSIVAYHNAGVSSRPTSPSQRQDTSSPSLMDSDTNPSSVMGSSAITCEEDKDSIGGATPRQNRAAQKRLSRRLTMPTTEQIQGYTTKIMRKSRADIADVRNLEGQPSLPRQSVVYDSNSDNPVVAIQPRLFTKLTSTIG